MYRIFRNVNYRNLFAAQIVALLGTGLATIALALLSFQLAGENAGAVLGTALFIKMIAYVSISPISGALISVLPRKLLMVSMDFVRAGIVLLLLFVDQIWHIYVLIFLLQCASAIFTPTFQAIIPEILPDEQDYTRALSLSRLAYDLENLLSPVIASLLLLVISFHWLFAGTAIGFVLSSFFVISSSIPSYVETHKGKNFLYRTTRGLNIFIATPRLRGLLALNLSAAAAGAMVIVNTVVIVGSILGRSESDFGIAMVAFGAGSMLAALVLPRLLDWLSDRTVMLIGASSLGILLVLFAIMLEQLSPNNLWAGLLLFWGLLGIAYSSVLTPTGRLLTRSTHPEDRPAVFAAQFALSHACWLITYPLAGWIGSTMGMTIASYILSIFTLIGAITALKVWSSNDTRNIEHSHPELPHDHPHLNEGEPRVDSHVHKYIIDDLHPIWPNIRHSKNENKR